MKLSVIIPTRNRLVLLEKALESLLDQTLSQEHFEVIVVDNGSTDNTIEVVNSFNTRLKNIRYFLEHQPGLHVGRHKGLAEAKSDFLVFADDDIKALPTWLESIYESFLADDIALIGGKNLPDFECSPPVWLREMWDTSNEIGQYMPFLSLLDMGDQIREINPLYVFGCNFSIRRDVLLAAGGFHPDSMPREIIRFRGDGETHVCQFICKMNLRTIYHPKAAVLHYVPCSRMKLKYFYQRAFNQGISNSFTNIRNKGRASDSENIKTKIMDDILLKISGVLFSSTGSRNLLNKIIDMGYINGFNYHNKLACNDDELLRWVLKESWLDLPK